jgi:hypothetical protein
VQAGTLLNTSSSISYMAVTQISSVSNIRGVANLDYNLVETDTNTRWIDGKTIYRKVILFGALPNATAKNVPHGISLLRELVNTKIISRAGYTAYRDVSIYNVIVDFFVTDVNVQITSGSNLSSYTQTYIILEYTRD